jgi:hypothetical protein
MPSLATLKDALVARKVALMGMLLAGLVYASSAATINLTPITEIITGVVGILPSFLDLVLGIIPIVIVLSVAGFLIKFWNKILDMIQF